MSKDTPLIKLLGSDVEVQNLTAHQSLKIVLIHNKKLRAEKEALEDSYKPLKKKLAEYELTLNKKNSLIREQKRTIKALKKM